MESSQVFLCESIMKNTSEITNNENAQTILAKPSSEGSAKDVVVQQSHGANHFPGACKQPQTVEQSDLNSTMKKIESETEDKLKQAPVGHWLSNPESLIGVMQSGADEFKAKTGRNMTYAEMRSMYG